MANSSDANESKPIARSFGVKRVRSMERAPNRRGVFIGSYVSLEAKQKVADEADRYFFGNVSLAVAELLSEALEAREKGREK